MSCNPFGLLMERQRKTVKGGWTVGEEKLGERVGTKSRRQYLEYTCIHPDIYKVICHQKIEVQNTAPVLTQYLLMQPTPHPLHTALEI